jgi:hypothetical protein
MSLNEILREQRMSYEQAVRNSYNLLRTIVLGNDGEFVFFKSFKDDLVAKPFCSISGDYIVVERIMMRNDKMFMCDKSGNKFELGEYNSENIIEILRSMRVYV